MKIFNQLLGRFGRPPLKNVEAAGERVFHEVFVRREGARLTPHMDAEFVRFTDSRLPVFALALAVLLLVLMVASIRKLIWQPEAIAQLQTGEKIGAGEMVRANGGASTVLKLADGSREMRADSELFIERADDGVRLHLNQGTVIVNAAKQRNGHLYVHARDITVSVGAVFFVKTEEAGSRVGVLEGLVVVSHEEISRKLGAGEEFSSPRCFEYHSRI